jgi:hypothetical protein
VPKRTSKKVPAGAVPVLTYTSLFAEIDAFAHGERSLLVVVGPPGTAKSTAARHHLPQARVIEGGATPYRLYMNLYEARDLPVVLDDADKVFRNRDGVFLLKLATQTTPVKTIQWNSNTPEIRSGDLPAEFQTTSRMLILANSWPQENPDIEAIESRGHLLYFAPSLAEIHRHAGTFVRDTEVYEFIGDHLGLLDRLDLRVYFKAEEVKATGRRTGDADGWKEFVRAQMMEEEKRVALNLIREPGHASDNQRAQEFARITGMSSRAFYRYRDELRARQPELSAGNACQGVETDPGLTV